MLALWLAASLAAPDVVFLSVDTLRADCLAAYGGGARIMPCMNAFADEAFVFEDCVCEVPLTAPSFMSMLTSRLPRTMGVTRNGLRLPADVPTVAELFQLAGYQTVCVQSNWTLKAHLSGLNRGFEQYEDDFHRKRWGLIKSERYADEVTDVALELLRQRDAKRPLFLWVHYSDPHAPYRFHEAFNPSGKSVARLAKGERSRAEYESEAAFTDHHIQRLLEALSKDNLFVLFAADHGESLQEHNYVGHGRRLYQHEVHIPLMVRGPGIAPGRAAAPVRGIDIGPTLLRLAGLDPAKGMLGLALIGAEVPISRVRVIETYGGAVPHIPGARALMAGRPPMRESALRDGWKLIIGGPEEELFHVAEDPDELHNCAEDIPDRVRQLRDLIQAWEQATPRAAAQEGQEELNKDDIEALRSLGYVE